MPKRRQARLLLILSMVLSAHLAIVWLLVSSPQRLMKAKSRSLQLVWIPPPASSIAPEPETTSAKPRNSVPRHRNDRIPASPPTATPSDEENNAIHPTPDWNAELQLAAKHALAQELAKKKHDTDFAHVFPTQPNRLGQFAWDHAATHRVESLPEGGLLINLSDNCVLLIFPLPLVACGIGKHPANGDLFEHMHEK